MMDERSERPEQEAHPETAAPAETTELVDTLRAEVARYKEEAERNWQQFLHAAADLENYKKQAARQREGAVAHVRTSLLFVILTVVDNLERALEHSTEADESAVVEGIRMTHRHVMDLLTKMGVQPMEAKGKPFDPRYHDAVDITSHRDPDVRPDTVVDEIQRGYLLHGEVLRPARVRVAK